VHNDAAADDVVNVYAVVKDVVAAAADTNKGSLNVIFKIN